MRYSSQLREIGDRFRESILGSTDELDKTLLMPNWENQKPKAGTAIGGDYLCIHWRRRDFIRAHASEVPSIEGTVKQVKIM
jgi:peptide-O-fucosyltransferase